MKCDLGCVYYIGQLSVATPKPYRIDLTFTLGTLFLQLFLEQSDCVPLRSRKWYVPYRMGLQRTLVFSNCIQYGVMRAFVSRLLQNFLGYIVQSEQLVVFLNTLASGGESCCRCKQSKPLFIIRILCLSWFGVSIIPDNSLQQYRTVLFTLHKRAF